MSGGHLSIFSGWCDADGIVGTDRFASCPIYYGTEIGGTYLGTKAGIIIMGITQVSDTKTWETDVMGSSVPVFVDFWAEWCGPCRMVGPVVEELAADYEGKVSFVKVNVDDAGELASKYNVFSIPTLAIFNKGEIVSQQVGAASKDAYKNMIDKVLEKA